MADEAPRPGDFSMWLGFLFWVFNLFFDSYLSHGTLNRVALTLFGRDQFQGGPYKSSTAGERHNGLGASVP